MNRRLSWFLLCGCLLALTGWKAPHAQVTITLDDNLESCTVRRLQAEAGVPLGEEPDWYPSREGCNFAGWFLDREGLEPFDCFADTVRRDMTLYAGYVPRLVLSDKGKVARVTGNSLPGEELPNPNCTVPRYNLGGTDLGIIWEMSDGTYAIAFGDSYGSGFTPCGGGPGAAGDWRSNTLAYSRSTDFSGGLIFSGMMTYPDNPSLAAPLIEREDFYEFTYIPTSAISLGGKEYVHYMYWEVMHRERADLNYSSFCVSEDAGKTWTNQNGSYRIPGDSWFCMVALARREGDPWCYMMGSQSGHGYRRSTGRLARFRGGDILDRSRYEYWNGDRRKWMAGEESLATDVLDGRVGEMSIQYMEKYRQWLALYFDGSAIVYRTAARINGPWSEKAVLCSGRDPRYRGIYGSFIHPACADARWDGDLYWTMSQWTPYNVFLMRAQMSVNE